MKIKINTLTDLQFLPGCHSVSRACSCLENRLFQCHTQRLVGNKKPSKSKEKVVNK